MDTMKATVLADWSLYGIFSIAGLNNGNIIMDRHLQNRTSLEDFRKIQTGIYFLWRDGEIFYVGQSTCIFSRVRNYLYKMTKKSWDEITYTLCDESELDDLETRYIHKLRPKGQGGRYRFHIPNIPLWKELESENE